MNLRHVGIGVVRLTVVVLLVNLAACSKDKSEIRSGGGSAAGVTSDGGVTSARYAGTYSGTITVRISGSSIADSSRTDDMTLVIKSDGTATLTIDGNTIRGVINGDAFGFSIQIIEEQDLVKCRGTANLAGKISGTKATGSLSGGGSCEVLAVKTGFDIGGSLSGTKI